MTNFGICPKEGQKFLDLVDFFSNVPETVIFIVFEAFWTLRFFRSKGRQKFLVPFKWGQNFLDASLREYR